MVIRMNGNKKNPYFAVETFFDVHFLHQVDIPAGLLRYSFETSGIAIVLSGYLEPRTLRKRISPLSCDSTFSPSLYSFCFAVNDSV